MSARRLILLAALLVLIVLGGIAWREYSGTPQTKEASAPVVVKQPVNFAARTFDPANPATDMPPLPPGENAECDSNFTSMAVVSGTSRRTDSTHATVTVTKIKVTLGLIVIIWLPEGATQHVQEHEEGHRRISEAYYQTADQIAARVAANYMGKPIDVSGPDLNAESNQALRQVGAEISDEYNKELNPNPAQLLYDSITDHSRNGVAAQDAVAHALKNVSVESSPAAQQ